MITRFIKLASKERKTGASGVVVNTNLLEVPLLIIEYKDCVSGNYEYSKGEVFSTMVCGFTKKKNVYAFILKHVICILIL